MRKVASACDLSAPAIYRHFTDKDHLLSAAVAEGARLFSHYLLGALTEATPFARLKKLGERYFDFALEHPKDYELLFVVNCRALGLERLDERAQAETGASFRILVDRVAECQASGELRPGPLEPTAVYIWASVHGFASLALSGHLRGAEDTWRSLFAMHQELLLAGLQQRPA
jgi:AcrR family transcriptional regulator